MMATSTSWKTKPFVDGVPLPYTARFSDTEMLLLRRGLVPRAMEDKWFVYFEAPYLFLHRSWTGEAVFRLKLETASAGFEVTESLWATQYAANLRADIQYEAKLVEFLVSNLLLGQSKPFPRPARLVDPLPGLFQHHIAGTGFNEEPHAADASASDAASPNPPDR